MGAVDDKFDIGDLVNCFECGDYDDKSCGWGNCVLLDYPSQTYPFWLVRDGQGVLMALPMARTIVRLKSKKHDLAP